MLLLFAGCSTSRNTFFNRNYHELNTYYNVYFNGRESLKQASKKIEAIEPQNFDEILPVFAFQYQEAAGMVASEAQRAVDKGTKAVLKHSITAKPKRKKNMTREQREFYNKKEFNRFIDDAHLLTGKANVLIHEYGTATEKFDFIASEYPKETSIYETQVWQAILLSYSGEYTKSQDLLVSLTRRKDSQALKKITPLLNAAFADLYIKQKKYADAIPYLEKALKKAKKKNTKIRYNYILGQLYGALSNNSKAAFHFSKVLKLNPPYFTAFSAEMAMAHTYDPATQKGNIRKMLEKALKNEQNQKYHDQIYYAFAKLEESEGQQQKALEYYRKSISATGINTRQKGLSYMALAAHYNGLNDYVNTYVCYDSAAIMLGREHSLYKEAADNATRLRKLALNLKTVEREDSLQKLASLSDNELNDVIDKQIKQAEEKRQKTEQDKANLDKLQSDINAVKGQWYFYNPVSVTLGQKDFAIRWGDRKLEDNWRRANKGVQMHEYDDFETSDELEQDNVAASDSINRDAILANVPKTAEAQSVSNDKIVSAMFNIGEAFRDDLKQPDKAADAFEKLLQRFPQNTLLPDIYVALYEIYTQTGETAKAAYFKNLMLQNYPKYPKVLAATDPGYIGRTLAQEAAEEADYSAALALYLSNRLPETFSAAGNGLAKYPSGRLVPQFSLLKTLSANYNNDIVAYRNALKDIIARFEKNEAANYAKTILEKLGQDELAWTNAQTETQKTETPKADADKPKQEYSTDDGAHSFVVVVDAGINTNKLRFNILSFAADKFPDNRYDEVKIIDFADNKMLIMSGIKNKKDAILFYKAIAANDEVFKDLSANDYVHFVALDANLEQIRKNSSFIDYMDFFYNTIEN
jgi:tetratricopeptide (TPR) repeat protein